MNHILSGAPSHFSESVGESLGAEELAAILDASDAPTFAVRDPQDGILVYANNAGRELVRRLYGLEIVLGKFSIHQFHPDGAADRVRSILAGMPQGSHRDNAEVAVRTAKGETFLRSSTVRLAPGGNPLFITVFRDVTSEREEIDSSRRLRDTIEHVLAEFAASSTQLLELAKLRRELEETVTEIWTEHATLSSSFESLESALAQNRANSQKIHTAFAQIATLVYKLKMVSFNGRIITARAEGDTAHEFKVVTDEATAIAEQTTTITTESMKTVDANTRLLTEEIATLSKRLSAVISSGEVVAAARTVAAGMDRVMETRREADTRLISMLEPLVAATHQVFERRLSGQRKTAEVLRTFACDRWVAFSRSMSSFAAGKPSQDAAKKWDPLSRFLADADTIRTADACGVRKQLDSLAREHREILESENLAIRAAGAKRKTDRDYADFLGSTVTETLPRIERFVENLHALATAIDRR